MDLTAIVGTIFTSALFMYVLTTSRLFSYWHNRTKMINSIQNDQSTLETKAYIVYSKCRLNIIKTLRLMIDDELKQINDYLPPDVLKQKANKILKWLGEIDDNQRKNAQDNTDKGPYFEKMTSKMKRLETIRSSMEGVRSENGVSYGLFLISTLCLAATNQFDISGYEAVSIIFIVTTIFEISIFFNKKSSSQTIDEIGEKFASYKKSDEEKEQMFETEMKQINKLAPRCKEIGERYKRELSMD